MASNPGYLANSRQRSLRGRRRRRIEALEARRSRHEDQCAVRAQHAGSVPGSAVTRLYDIDPGPDCPEVVRMIVEIPKNSSNKYEYDGKLHVFRLDRALYSPLHYPGDYGFIPGTLSLDRDPLDVLTLVDEASYPGVLIAVRPVGMLEMVDQDEQDQKILAVPNRNPRFAQ